VGKVDSEKKVKYKVIPRTSNEGPDGVQRYSSNLSLTSALDGGVGGPGQSPAALHLGRRPCTHCTRGCVGARAGIYVSEKSRPIGIGSPNRAARSKSLCRLRSSDPQGS